MTWLIIIGCALLFVLCFLVLTPLVIKVDSSENIYEVRLTGIAKIDIQFKEDMLVLNIGVMGWKKTIEPFAISSSGYSTDIHGKGKKKKKK